MDDIKPSRWYYCLAVLIFIAGGVIFFSYLFSSLGDLSEELTQIVVPGSSDLVLGAGKYTIFYENESVVDGRIYSTGQAISGLQIELKNKSTGFKVPLHSPQGSFTYSIGGRSGRAILEFGIDRQGVYELSALYLEGSGPEVVLAVGRGLFDNLISVIVVGIVIYLGSILASMAIVVVVYQKRRSARQRIKEGEEAIRGRRSS